MKNWGWPVALGLLLFWTSVAQAYELHRDTFRSDVGIATLECETCHQNRAGGDACTAPPCLNRFGLDYQSELGNGPGVWFRIADLDSDGDGYSNRLEFGDEDGDGISEHGRVSSASVDQGDLDECAIGMVTCPSTTPHCRNTLTCAERERPSYECGTTPATAPPRSYIDDPWNRAQTVDSNEWVEVDSYHDYNPNVPTACGSSVPSVWLRYYGTCAGVLRAELRTDRGVDPDPLLIGRYNEPAGGCTPDHAPEEVTCGTSVRRDSGPLVRVMGRIRGEVRLYCAPNESASCSTDEGIDPDDPSYEFLPSPAIACTTRDVSCEFAEPVVEGTHIVDAFSGQCTQVDGGAWLSYTASCTGTVEVVSGFHWNSDPNRQHGASVGLYRGACPSGERVGCESARSVGTYNPDNRSREAIRQHIDAIVGETIYIQVGGRGQERVTVSCEANVNPELCYHCDEAAECDFDMGEGSVSCLCPERMEGDGLAVSHGGEGCVPLPANEECEMAGLFCDEHAFCIAIPGDPLCRCKEGYFGSGFECLEVNACEDTRCAGHHQTCIDNLKGIDCVCDTGYSRDPNKEELTCIRVCGDGANAPGEFCDDGNYINGDGCSAECEIELDFKCRTVGSTRGLSVCENTCGDGLIDENEDPLCEVTIDLDEICDCGAAPGRPSSGWGGGLLLGLVVLLGFRRRRR